MWSKPLLIEGLAAKLDSTLRLDEILKNLLVKSLRYLQPWPLYHFTVKTPFYLDERSFTVTCVHYLSVYNCTSLKRVQFCLSHSHPPISS